MDTWPELAPLLDGVDDTPWQRAWPGPPPTRQPVHVLYVPADRVDERTIERHGEEALRLLRAHAPDGATLSAATGIPDELADVVHDRVAAKLEREPIEDLRVDFEDGYLGRSTEEEHDDTVRTARALAGCVTRGTAPAYFGLRVKSFTDGLAQRSAATLATFIDTLLEELGELPAGFVVTFPKIVAVDHVRRFADLLGHLEEVHGLPPGRLRFEAQIETTASVVDADGRLALRPIHQAASGRLCAAHLGVYDYTAGLGLPPDQQRLDHPACDFVRHLLQVTFAGTEVRLSDGSTNAVPADETTAELHRVWSTHARMVRHSLAHGFVQGWDLHASHLVSRFAVVYAELLGGLDDAIDRLAAWEDRQDATGVLDEPATIRRLQAQLQRAVDAGAVDANVVSERLGRSFTARPATLDVDWPEA